MKSTTKGALSSVAALVLLTGGAGSLAYWSAEEPVSGTDIDAGHLDLVTDATNVGCGAWTLGHTTGQAAALGAGDLLVPGDVLRRACAFTVDATGKNLAATLSIDSPTFADGDDFDGMLDASVSGLTVGADTAATGFTSADDGETLLVDVVVTWDAADTGNMDASTVLEDLTLVATQVAP